MLYSQTKGVKRRIFTVYSTLNIWQTIKTMYTCDHSKESNNVCDNFTLPVFSTLDWLQFLTMFSSLDWLQFLWLSRRSLQKSTHPTSFPTHTPEGPGISRLAPVLKKKLKSYIKH